MAKPYVVIATPTIMDGLVLRWYRSEHSAENGNELMSVSRNGVRVHCFLHEISRDEVEAANFAYQGLATNVPGAYEVAASLATHRRKHLMGDAIEPMPKAVDRAQA